jgi:hypothetical protein
MDLQSILAFLPAKDGAALLALCGVAAIVAPFLPEPQTDATGARAKAYRAIYIAVHFAGQNREKVQAALKPTPKNA